MTKDQQAHWLHIKSSKTKINEFKGDKQIQAI
jgi:hypothetical protein